MLINGVTKLSYSLTLNNNKSALSSIIISLIIVLLGILLIINPFQGAKKIVQILGISILVYSLLDLIECFLIKRVMKKVKKIENNNVIDAEYTEL